MSGTKALSEKWSNSEALIMQVIADFHTHSRFAMACSSKITLNGMDHAAFEKGINLIGDQRFSSRTVACGNEDKP